MPRGSGRFQSSRRGPGPAWIKVLLSHAWLRVSTTRTGNSVRSFAGRNQSEVRQLRDGHFLDRASQSGPGEVAAKIRQAVGVDALEGHEKGDADRSADGSHRSHQ